MKVVNIVGKSGTGKSTMIDFLVHNFPEKFHAVKSYTTRAVRENDPKDIDTHCFVNEAFWEQRKDKAIAVYHSAKGYTSWADATCFEKDKINLYAIDSKATNAVEFWGETEGHLVETVYLFCDESVRKRRFLKREGTLKGYNIEDALDAKHIAHPYTVINVTEQAPSQASMLLVTRLVKAWGDRGLQL